MLTLADYLKCNRLTQEDFASRFSPRISRVLVCRWLIWLEWRDERARGQGSLWRPPARALRVTEQRALQIELVTKGKVSRRYLRPDLFPAGARRRA